MVVKINVSITEKLLKQLDTAAHERKISRSGLLSQAIKHFLQERAEQKPFEKRLDAVKPFRKIGESVGPWDGTAEVLELRNCSRPLK